MVENRGIKRWKQILGMDSYKESTNLPEGVLRLIQNMRPGKGSLYTREGLTKFDSSQVVTSQPILGLGRYYPDTSTSLELAVSNGILKSSLGSGWTQRATGLSSSNLCKIEQFKDKALICDQSTGLLVYQDYTVPATDEHSTHYAGVPSPKVYKLISSFEDAADWTGDNGCTYAAGTITNDQGHQLHGRQSVKFTLASGVTNISNTFTALNLDGAAVFSDGSTSDLDDYISLFIIRGDPNLITSVRLVLGDNTFTNTFYYDLSSTEDWIEAVNTYSGLHLRLRKRYFQTLAGTPNWGVISGVKFIATTTGVTSLTMDWLRLEKSGPIAWELLKVINDCDDTTDWTVSAGSATVGLDYEYKVRGDAALKITTPSNTCLINTGTVSIDLTTFDDGSIAAAIDDVEIYLGKSVQTISPIVQLRLYTEAAKYYYYDFAISSVKSLTQYSISKTSFSSSGTPTGWTIIKVGLYFATGFTGSVYIDAINLVKHKDTLSVAEMDQTEGWVAVAPTTTTPAYSNEAAYIRADQGSTQSLYLNLIKSTANGGVATISYTPGGALNLSIYSAGIAIQSTDQLGLYMNLPSATAFGRVTLQLGPVGMANNYYQKTIEKADLSSYLETPPTTTVLVEKGWYKLFFAISEWDAVGAPNWNSLAQVRISLQVGTTTNGTSYPSIKAYFDSWKVKRASELTGVYYYKETFVDPEGNESDASIISEPVTARAASVFIKHLPTLDGANSARVASKRIYRLGGLNEDWGFVATLDTPSRDTYLDENIDAEITGTLEDIDGQPYIPKCFCTHNNKVVIANLTTLDGITYPSGIMVSEEESCEIYDHKKFFELEAHSGSEIKWITPFSGFVFVGKEDMIGKFNPDDLTQPYTVESTLYGGVGLLAVCYGKNEFYFLDKTGIIFYNGSFFDVISDQVQDYIDAIPPTYLSTCWMEYFEDTLLIGIPVAGGTYPTLVLACYKPESTNRFWYIISGWSTRCVSSGEGTLHVGSALNGYVWRAFDGDTDDAVDITSILWFPDDDFEQVEVGKDFVKLFLFGKRLTSTNVPIIINPYIDMADSGINITQDIEAATISMTSLIHNKIEISGVQFGYFPSYLGLKLTATKRWTFRELVEIIRWKGATY